MAFNPQETYAGAVTAYDRSQTEVQDRTSALQSLYNAAIDELGYSKKDLKNNSDARKEVARLMFSKDFAGNKKLNPLLGNSVFYQGFDEADATQQQSMHQLALGLNTSQLQEIVKDRPFDSTTFAGLLNQLGDNYSNQQVQGYLTNTITGTLSAQKAAYAQLAELDPNVGEIDPANVEMDEIKGLVGDSVAGSTSRDTLEKRVGVELPKYEWKKAA